jgi:uracil-DNA glycosylase family 4
MLLDQLRAYVEYQQSTGVEDFPLHAPLPAAEASGALPRPAPPAAPVAVETPALTKVVAGSGDLFVSSGVRRADTLETLRAEIGDCQRCKLWPGRTHLVFGVGNPQAKLMFVGEGPGRDEDLQGEPFVGRAGQLLTEIITKGMKLRREEVYIANVIKCRPPENRNPEPDEIASCQPFLLRQIEIVRPKVLVALGTFAAQTLLGLRAPISRLRGHWYDYHGIKLMPTLHPAYLLRNPNDKKLVWADIKMVMAELERHA